MSTRITALVALVALSLICWAGYQVAFQVPNELEQGVIFKIFFFHVPAAWLMLLSGLVCAAGAAAHLKGIRGGDAVAAASGELAFVFGIIVMATGAIWAHRAWGKAWVWDARLTTSLICWLTFAVYVFVRRFAGPSAPRISSVLAIFGAVNIPVVFFSVKLWSRGFHPPPSVVQTLEPVMTKALFTALGGFSALWCILFAWRLREERLVRSLDALRAMSKPRR
ncbi:MAG: cytochrome c biogenesis protein CcsA [Polyangia bacterium]|jgi:heme exporter protein C|nr:cytochrome c biogenesis protein CcsA [Polyangia bacterium]